MASFQDTIALTNQMVNNPSASMNQTDSVTPYMPLIFNANSPEGRAASLLVGNLLNNWIGRRNDRANDKRFAAAQSAVDGTMAQYGQGGAGYRMMPGAAAKAPGESWGDPMKEWIASAGLTGDKKLFVDKLQRAKSDYAIAQRAGNEARMAEIANMAQGVRDQAARQGIDLTGYGADVTADDFASHYLADSRRTMDAARGLASSGDYYNRLVEAGMAQGMSRKKAERYAANAAAQYQNKLRGQYGEALRDYGYDGSGRLNQFGVEMINAIRGENGEKAAAGLLGSALTPKEGAQLDAQRQWQQEQLAARERMQREAIIAQDARLDKQMAHQNAMLGARLAAAKGAGTKQAAATQSWARPLTAEQELNRMRELKSIGFYDTDENGNRLHKDRRAIIQQRAIEEYQSMIDPNDPITARAFLDVMSRTGLFDPDELQDLSERVMKSVSGLQGNGEAKPQEQGVVGTAVNEVGRGLTELWKRAEQLPNSYTVPGEDSSVVAANEYQLPYVDEEALLAQALSPWFGTRQNKA